VEDRDSPVVGERKEHDPGSSIQDVKQKCGAIILRVCHREVGSRVQTFKEAGEA